LALKSFLCSENNHFTKDNAFASSRLDGSNDVPDIAVTKGGPDHGVPLHINVPHLPSNMPGMEQ
jgi:hypothetical protein